MAPSVRISRKDALALLRCWGTIIPGLPAVVDRDVERAIEVLEQVVRAKPKRSVLLHRKRKRASRAEKNAETAGIYAEVEKRADGVCEACGNSFWELDRPHMDHFFKRAKVPQAVSNCWLIHRQCDHLKTNNMPSAVAWLERFIAHCRQHGYLAEARRAESNADWEKTGHRLDSLRKERTP